MLRKLCLMLALLGVASPTFGQLNLSYTSFQPGQTISSAQFTANFTAISSNALNRTNGVMTGPLQAQNITVGTNNTYDIGATGARFRDFWLARNATIGGDVDITGTLDVGGVTILSDLTTSTATVTTADITSLTVTNLTCTGCVGATQLASSGVSASSYGSASAVGTFTVDADGRLTTAATTSIEIAESQITDGSVLARIAANETISGTWTFSNAPTLAGTNVTAIPEANITDGSILARLAGTETISGAWTFTNTAPITLSSVNPQIFFRESDAGTNEKVWRFIANSDSFLFTLLDDSNANNVTLFSIDRSGLTPGDFAFAVDVVPSADSTYTLGTNSVRWSHGYFDDITIGAAFTSNAFVLNNASESTIDSSIDGDSLRIRLYGTSLYTASFTDAVTKTHSFSVGTGSDFLLFDGSAFYPVAASAYNIGTSSARFGTIYATNALNTPSDIRLKENIVALPYGLEDLKRINVYQYNMIGDTRVQNGVIAQQLLEAGFGHIVSGSESEGYGVAYTELIPVLIKSIQELEARVAELEGR